jgi:Mn2+/Fe2+ NRAMP family transporter
MAPVTFPMMFAVVYLSARLGQVTGQGLFAVLRKHYSRKALYPTLVCVLIGNTIEAGADLGGIAAAINLLLPIPILFASWRWPCRHTYQRAFLAHPDWIQC